MVWFQPLRFWAQVVGASKGVRALVAAGVVAAWGPLFSLAPIQHVLRFIDSLIHPPGSPEVARLFATHMLAAVGRALLQLESTDDKEVQESAWPLLVDLCHCLQLEV